MSTEAENKDIELDKQVDINTECELSDDELDNVVGGAVNWLPKNAGFT